MIFYWMSRYGCRLAGLAEYRADAQDEVLRRAVADHGGKNWKAIAEHFDGERSDVQCLHRWQKVLNPDLVKGPWTLAVCCCPAHGHRCSFMSLCGQDRIHCGVERGLSAAVLSLHVALIVHSQLAEPRQWAMSIVVAETSMLTGWISAKRKDAGRNKR